jgi:light-regulated signal transduction histidine kinase (bacteriophytochrome)
VFAASPEGRFTEVPLVRGLDVQIAQSISGDAWLAAVHPDDLQEFCARWRDSVQTETQFDFDFRVQMQDGSYRWHCARAVRVVGEAGTTVEWVGSCVDIHDRVLSEQRLKNLNADLDERVRRRTADLQLANEEMEGFTYSVSHDLRAPLRAIVATSKILLMESENLSQLQREMLLRQAYNGNRLATLMDELLHLSRIGRHEIVRVEIDMTSLAHEVIEDFRVGSSEKFQFEVATGLLAAADRSLVRLILGNLIENAIKFSPNGGKIRFGQKKMRQEQAFFIADEGVGFDMAFVDKVFLPFERLVLESEFPGTGIGLANVKRIVQRHGGRVWAEAQTGKGATFYFTLGSG